MSISAPAAVPAPAGPDPRAEAITRLEHVIDELGELLLDQFIWKSTEKIALANSNLRAAPFYISWIGQNYYRRAAAAARAMVDSDERTDSIVTVLRYIKDNAGRIAPTLTVPDLLDEARTGFDTAKIDNDVQKLLDAAQAVRQYVNQYLAHIQRSPRAPVPTVSDIDALIEQLHETARRYYLALTGGGYDTIEPRVQFDWTAALRHPWIESA